MDLSQVATIPLRKRTTIRSLARELNVSRSTLHRAFKEGKIRRHSNTLKPYLRDENKKSRLRYCVSMLDSASVQDHPTFIDMRCIVHIDEKWFYTTTKTRRFYMLPEEQNPLRTMQNNNSIGKVMFLCALARPRYDADGNCTFDGKIGVWPFIKTVSLYLACYNFIAFMLWFPNQFYFSGEIGTSKTRKSLQAEGYTNNKTNQC